MFRRAVVLVGLAAVLGVVQGCSGDYEARLPNGYRLIRTNAPTVMIWVGEGMSARVVIAPTITSMNIHGDIVYGLVELDDRSDFVDKTAPGYFVLDTAYDSVQLGLAAEEYAEVLRGHGVADPFALKSPRSFRRRR